MVVRLFILLQALELLLIPLVQVFLLNMFVLPVAVVVVHRIMLEVEVQVDI
jgi:hypothetical protein|tara:strand:- start:749 stop:901 length:153 start_codon:yes stop_codon:yes gene_type:complete